MEIRFSSKSQCKGTYLLLLLLRPSYRPNLLAICVDPSFDLAIEEEDANGERLKWVVERRYSQFLSLWEDLRELRVTKPPPCEEKHDLLPCLIHWVHLAKARIAGSRIPAKIRKCCYSQLYFVTFA